MLHQMCWSSALLFNMQPQKCFSRFVLCGRNTAAWLKFKPVAAGKGDEQQEVWNQPEREELCFSDDIIQSSQFRQDNAPQWSSCLCIFLWGTNSVVIWCFSDVAFSFIFYLSGSVPVLADGLECVDHSVRVAFLCWAPLETHHFVPV